MTVRLVFATSFALALCSGVRPAGQTSAPAPYTPSVEFEKAHFAPTDHVFFWIGVTTAPHVMLPAGGEGRVILTRPDGSVRVDQVSNSGSSFYGVVTDPATGQTHLEGGGWKGGWGLGDEKSQLGRYTVVFEYSGVASAPAAFVVEDAPILRSIHAEITLPSPLSLSTSAPVSLLVRNDTDEAIQFPKFASNWQMVRTGSMGVTLTDDVWQSFFVIPESVLLPAQRLAPMTSFPTALRWNTLDQFATVRLIPGASYRLDVPLDKVLASRSQATPSSRIARRGAPTAPGECRLTVTATLKVFVGEAGGPWADFSPFDVDARASGVLPTQPSTPCAGPAPLLIH